MFIKNLRLIFMQFVPIPLFVKRLELERLFSATVLSFNRIHNNKKSPFFAFSIRKSRAEKNLLAEYAHFTSKNAIKVLAQDKNNIESVKKTLYNKAKAIGNRYYRLFGLQTRQEALVMAKRIYKILGIDFFYDNSGNISIPQCFFSKYYTPGVCSLISSLDSGLIAGMTQGGELQFEQRITEGAPICIARLYGGLK